MLIFLIVLSLLGNVGLSLVVFQMSKKLLQFDEVFEMFVDDIQINVKFFDKLMQTPILEHSPEIMQAHRNMRVIMNRLNEFAIQMGETSNNVEITPEE